MPRKRRTAVERQRLYRARLAERGAPATSGALVTRGAPETRFVVQALAEAVRQLAAEVKKDVTVRGAHGASLQRILQNAHAGLLAKGFDTAESTSRVLLYVLPEAARKRRLREDTEARYWHPAPVPVRMVPAKKKV